MLIVRCLKSMFKKEETNTNFKEAETIIGPSVKVEGDFAGQGNLIIDGVVKGSVSTDGNLKVGEQAKITASVKADNAFVSGEIKGNMIIKGDLELTNTAKVWGDIEAKSICVARGAVLNGKFTMTGTKGDEETKETKQPEEVKIIEEDAEKIS